MFEGLKWKPAARRSAIVIAIYLGLLYVLSRVFPNSNFNLDTWTDAVRLLVNAAIFFFIFTFIYALLERSRERRAAEAGKQKKPGKTTADKDDPAPDGTSLKGLRNPNTSRKKSRRRR